MLQQQRTHIHLRDGLQSPLSHLLPPAKQLGLAVQGAGLRHEQPLFFAVLEIAVTAIGESVR